MRKPRSARVLSALAAASALVANPAFAADQMYSYLPADDDTRALADSGFTLLFDRVLLGGARMQKIMSTEASASADLKPAVEHDLGAPLHSLIGASRANDLYEIEGDVDQGGAMIHAFCPGSTRAWLAFGPIKPRRDLTINALGKDPKTGKARLCATLRFTFRGEWILPGQGIGQGPPKIDPLPRRDPGSLDSGPGNL